MTIPLADGIPPDGLPIESVTTYSTFLVIVIDTQSALGLGFTLICCFFNLFCRNKRQDVSFIHVKICYNILCTGILNLLS